MKLSYKKPDMNTYVIRAGNTNQYKIGKTSRSIRKRLRELQTGNPYPLRLYKVFPGDYERFLHIKFSTKRTRSNGEWFELDESDFKYINLKYSLPVSFRYYAKYKIGLAIGYVNYWLRVISLAFFIYILMDLLKQYK